MNKQELKFSENWIKYQDSMPTDEDGEVLCYSPEWIDEDFNPRGLRVGFMCGSGFISAFWWDYQDTYENDEKTVPLYWRSLDDFNLI